MAPEKHASKSHPVAIVTGGSRGIGRAVVETLAHRGIEVVFTYVSNAAAAAEVVQGLAGQGHRARAEHVDARDVQACRDFADRVMEEAGRIDILVNNAAVVRDKLLASMTADDWATVLETSLCGMFGTTQPVARQMLRQHSGRIVNVTSISGLCGMRGQTNYCTAKAGIIGFTRSLALELAPVGIAVNAIAPGYVDTDMLAFLDCEARRRVLASIPMHRMASAAEIASVVTYLALEAPSYLTGQTVVVDGGITL